MEEHKLYKCPECGGLFEEDELIKVKRMEIRTQTLPLGWYAKTICQYFNISMDDFLGKNRSAIFTQARRAYCYLICKYERHRYSLAAIGLFINRDHATVLHHNKKMIEEIDVYLETKEMMKVLDFKVEQAKIFEAQMNVDKIYEHTPQL